MKYQLMEMGFKLEDIKNMTPLDAHKILNKK